MRENIAPSILKSTSEKLLAAVFPNCGKVFGNAVSVLLGAMTDKGSPLIQSLAEKLREGPHLEEGMSGTGVGMARTVRFRRSHRPLAVEDGPGHGRARYRQRP